MFNNIDLIFIKAIFCWCGPGSSVGIATDYGLDRPRSNPGEDEIFRPSRPSLGPTQPPVKWVPAPSRGKVRPGPAADHPPPSSDAVMEEYSYTCTHPLGHTGPVTGSPYLYLVFCSYGLRFEIFMAVTKECSIFRNEMSCGLVEIVNVSEIPDTSVFRGI